MTCRSRSLAIPILMFIALGASNAFPLKPQKPQVCPSVITLMDLLESVPTGVAGSFVDQVALEDYFGRLKQSSKQGTSQYQLAERALRKLGELQKVRTTRAGATFTLIEPEELRRLGVSDPKEFGEGWRDPSGTAWGNVAFKELRPHYMTRQQALDFCQRIGAKLPSDSHFNRLAEYMGWDPKQDREIDEKRPPDFPGYFPGGVLPHFPAPNFLSLEDPNPDLCWWTSTQGPGGSASPAHC